MHIAALARIADPATYLPTVAIDSRDDMILASRDKATAYLLDFARQFYFGE